MSNQRSEVALLWALPIEAPQVGRLTIDRMALEVGIPRALVPTASRPCR